MKPSLYTIVTALILLAALPRAAEASGNFEIIVATNLYDDTSESGIWASLNQYQSDVEAQGYTASIVRGNFSTAEALQAHLASVYDTSGLAGAVLVGDLPHANLDSGTQVIPSDYFYMAPKASWHVNTSGNYPWQTGLGDWSTNDPRTGKLRKNNVQPQILVSRIAPANLSTLNEKTESAMINEYFDKDHRYRTGTMTLPTAAMFMENGEFNDTAYVAAVRSVYGTYLEQVHPALAYDFALELGASYPGFETTVTDTHGYYDGSLVFTLGATLNISELPGIGPKTLFSLQNACVVGNWTDSGLNFSGEMIFGSPWGLTSIGDSAAGDIDDMNRIFAVLGNGGTWGEALLAYYRDYVFRGDASGNVLHQTIGDGFLQNVGFNLQGDPLLTLQSPVAYMKGDANLDGKVSFADYLILEGNFGRTGMSWLQGDFNGDGKVSFADYLLLESNFGRTTVPDRAQRFWQG